MHTYIHAYIRTYTYTYTYTCIYIYHVMTWYDMQHIYIHTYIHTCNGGWMLPARDPCLYNAGGIPHQKNHGIHSAISRRAIDLNPTSLNPWTVVVVRLQLPDLGPRLGACIAQKTVGCGKAFWQCGLDSVLDASFIGSYDEDPTLF